MSSRSILALAAAALLAAATSDAGGAPPAVEIHGLKVSPPIAFSAPAPAGLDALLVVHPADARAGGEKLSLTAIAFPKDSGMTDSDLLDYVKTTFLATSDAGKPVERSFLGRKVKGQALEKKVPAPSRAEVYVVTRKGGDKVVLAFVFGLGFATEAETAIAGIASTMTE